MREGVGEYYRQMIANHRVLEQDAQGNWVWHYLDRGKADHYAHAEAYCLLASKDAGMPVFRREDIERAFGTDVVPWQR